MNLVKLHFLLNFYTELKNDETKFSIKKLAMLKIENSINNYDKLRLCAVHFNEFSFLQHISCVLNYLNWLCCNIHIL